MIKADLLEYSTAKPVTEKDVNVLLLRSLIYISFYLIAH